MDQLGKTEGHPVFQTEMQGDGLESAILIQRSLVTEGAAAYLQNALVVPVASLTTANPGPLIAYDTQTFALQPAYYTLQHFALHTDPGWVRVGSASSQDSLLVTAWTSPSGNALTIVVVNSSADAVDAELNFDQTAFATTQVTRTSFDGDERGTNLGQLPTEGVLRLPGHSMATVALSN